MERIRGRRVSENLQKNRWGSVNPYTRHIKNCKFRGRSSYHSCACPKWLYVYKLREKPKQFSLNTPSWAEASEIAGEYLRSFDPEIAAAREKAKKEKKNSRTVLEAIQLWLDRTETESGKDSGSYAQYRSTFGWVDKLGRTHGTLLGFIDEFNAKHPDVPINKVDQLTPLICQSWRDSSWFSSLGEGTRHQRWGVVRSFFAFLFNLGVIPLNPVIAIKAPPVPNTYAHVPFSPEQCSAILNEAAWRVDDRVRDGERAVYCSRLTAMVQLLLNTGMDLIDAVLFNPSVQIRDEQLDGVIQPVLRYIRTKTSIEAVIPLPMDIATTLRQIAPCQSSLAEMPFRYRGNKHQSDIHNWSRRISKLYSWANIKSLQLIGRDGRPAVDDDGLPITTTPDVKMFRHTFAVSRLSAGMREETVAKMLGLASTEMIRKHYAPWCKQRDEAHIREATIALQRRASSSNATLSEPIHPSIAAN